MAFIKLVFIFSVIVSLTTAQNVGPQSSNIQTQASLIRVLQVPEYIEQSQNPILSYSLQLPKIDNPIPFYNPDISAELKPPSNYYVNVPNYYEYPEPSQELQVPPVGSWNPNNDPALYYNVVDPVDQETPTDLHPKKFNKEVHDKDKQYNNVPKKEIVIEPVSIEEFAKQQKLSDKAAKHENKKELRTKKAEQTVSV